MAICIIPLKDGKSIKPAAEGLIRQARKLNSHITGIIIHCGMDESDIHLSCDEVLSIEIPEQKWPLAKHHIDAFMAVYEDQMEPVFVCASPLGNEIAAGLASRLRRPLLNMAMDVDTQEGKITSKKEIYGGKACLYEQVDFECIITFDPAYLFIDKNNSINVPKAIKQIPFSVNPDQNITFIKNKKLSWDEIELTEASCVIGIGRGVYQSIEHLDQIEKLAKLLNAPIGGSKVADELKLIPRERRIGSSGLSIEEASIYIAIGISGSSQHLDGIKNVKHVIAINSDSAAPIFNRADIGIIGEYEDVVPLLIKEIKSKSGVNELEHFSHS